GSELHACPLRGSGGNSAIARSTSGATRFTAQGSAWAPGAGVSSTGGAADGVSGAAAPGLGAVGSGVSETVESPAPQPDSSVTANATDPIPSRDITAVSLTSAKVPPPPDGRAAGRGRAAD